MSIKIKNRHRLKSRDIRFFQDEIKKTFPSVKLNEKSSIETGEFEGIKIVFIDGAPCFMFHENKIVFTLYGINKFNPRENYVVVDMGAVKFVTSGADVMVPGIVNADKNINEDSQVWICDETHKKPLAIGIAIMNGEQMISEEKGKAIKTIHHVGDMIWDFVAKSL